MNQLTEKFGYSIAAIAFLLCGLLAVYFSINSVLNLFSEIRIGVELVIIPKGLFYLFGGGITSLCLGYTAVYGIISSLPSKFGKISCRVFFFGGFVLMLVLPPIVHAIAESKLVSLNYTYCEFRSHTWLVYSDIAYVKSPELCVASDPVL